MTRTEMRTLSLTAAAVLASGVLAARPAEAGFCNHLGCVTPPPLPAPKCPRALPPAGLGYSDDPKDPPPDRSFLQREQQEQIARLREEWAGSAAERARTGQTSYPCYVAFIHGSGVDDSMYPGPSYSAGYSPLSRPHKVAPLGCPDAGSPESQEAYWSPPESVDGTRSFTFAAGRQAWSEGQRCMVWRVAYDGVSRTFAEGATQVATELVNFISRYRIPDKKLVIVTHSMGGLVGRFMLNNAAPTAPYHWPFFRTVAAKTSHMITVQAPHAGAASADALWGETEHVLGNISGWAAQAFDLQHKSRARESMRRTYVERAAALGGWMADAFRETKMYLVAGEEVRPTVGGDGRKDDENLQKVAFSLGYDDGTTRGSIHGDGTTDGLVETSSALGHWRRRVVSGWRNGPPPLQGRFSRWAVVQHNHNHARWNVIDREITVLRTDGNVAWQIRQPLGTFISDFGLDLAR